VQRILVIDSHTGGEPTRVVVEGGPDLGVGTLAGRCARFSRDFDHFRSAVVEEPRGSDVFVGALLCEPTDPTCSAAVIFFNNVGTLGMCGHGTIGLVASLAHLGRIAPGSHRIETPVGIVVATLHEDGRVAVENVPSYRLATGVEVEVPGHGVVRGDIAWGGNWFFLLEQHGQILTLDNVDALVAYTWAVRQGLERAGVGGADGALIDHVELFGPAHSPDADSRNFVLCPGRVYDRSPCGTGTSAKVACLYAEGRLSEGEVYRQEGIVGSVFEATVALRDGAIVPTVTGRAWVNAESTLWIDPTDPFAWGIPR